MSIITRINKAEKRIVDLYNKLKNLPSGGSGGEFIPLTGTEEGNPVTGDIELDAVNGSKKIIGAYGSTIEYADDGRILINNSISGGSNVVIGVGNFDFNEVLVSENDISEIDPTNKLIYAQRSYVDKDNSYSTDEMLTGGTWIDGKPIYRKVLMGTMYDETLEDFLFQKEFEIDLEMEIIDLKGFYFSAGGARCPINSSASYRNPNTNTTLMNEEINAAFSARTVIVGGVQKMILNAFDISFDPSTNSSFSAQYGYEYNIIIEYTKTTD